MRIFTLSSSDGRRAARTFVLSFFIIGLVGFFAAACSRNEPPKPGNQKPIQQDTFDLGPITPVKISPEKDLKKFLHADHTEQVDKRLNCNYCHGVEANLQKIRLNGNNEKEANKPPFSGHSSCMACHMAEFTQTKSNTAEWSGLCYACHKQVGIDKDAGFNQMKPFPARLSHNIYFTPEQHQEHTKYTYPADDPKLAGKKAECATCHEVQKSGPAVDFKAHVTCYACHRTNEFKAPGIGVKADVKPGALASGACNTCHQDSNKPEDLRPLEVKMNGVRSYQFKFTHREHEKAANCTSCHNINGTYATQVSSPKAKQHNGGTKSAAGQGCFSCHNDQRVFGDLNAQNCIRCHTPAQLGPAFTAQPSASIGGANNDLAKK